MPNRNDLTVWYQRLGISARTQALIDHIRSSHPARRVGGGRANVSGRYPSRKMGVTIQFESHRVELAAIYEMEHSPDVLEYYDQPPSIKLFYDSLAGKRLAVLHTPDFFVIRQNEAGWEEWKTEEDLHRLQERSPNRYQWQDGRWRCPPGEAHAHPCGLFYRVRSSKEIHWTYQRNIQFLEDYLRIDPSILPLPTEAREKILAYTNALPGISLEELLERTAEFATPDDVYRLIAADYLYVDLDRAALAEPEKVQVFPHHTTVAQALSSKDRPPLSRSETFMPSALVTWDGRKWQIVNVGEHHVDILGENRSLIELPLDAFESLAKDGRIKQIGPPTGDTRTAMVIEAIGRGNGRDLEVANQRTELLRLHASGEPMPGGTQASARSLRRWAAARREAERELGDGYVALIPRLAWRGNYQPKLPELSRKLMQKFIETEYETHKQKTRHAVWIALRLACQQQDVVAPCYKTFCRAVRSRSGPDQDRKRQGERAAYRHEPFYWELELKTPRHGDRPFEIAHIDHTELDVETVSSRTGRLLGRPWLTLMMDAFSRRVLASYLTFDPPSYRSCMMALRDCVRRNGRLPQILVMDGGAEFRSIYFESVLARFECIQKTRPPAKARFGAILERLFGTTNLQFVHNLEGNTQATRNVREVTRSVSPRRHAVWTLPMLEERLGNFFYEIYDMQPHPALGQSPREEFARGMARFGPRFHRLVAYDDDFLMATSPTTSKGTAKVVEGHGVKINHLYYWCEAFRHPDLAGQQVEVRFDPFDLGTAFAFVHRQWATCHSEHYLTFRGRSQREIMLATQELKRIRQTHAREYNITGSRLAEFLESIEAEEKLLQQRLRDAEASVIRTHASGCERSLDAQPSAMASEPLSFNEENIVPEVYGEF